MWSKWELQLQSAPKQTLVIAVVIAVVRNKASTVGKRRPAAALRDSSKRAHAPQHLRFAGQHSRSKIWVAPP